MKVCLNGYFMVNMNKEFRLRNIDRTLNYFTEEMRQSDLTSKGRRKVCVV